MAAEVYEALTMEDFAAPQLFSDNYINQYINFSSDNIEELKGTPFLQPTFDDVPYSSPVMNECFNTTDYNNKPIIEKLPQTDISRKRNSPDTIIHNMSRSPSPDEQDRQLKRQKRLIKNRESAQLSRQRKKVYIEELERKVVVLTEEKETLIKRNASLTKENQSLREEISQLKNNNSNGPLSNAAKKLAASKSAKAAGICLMIVLFSFGLFFNTTQRGLVQFEPAIEGIPEVVPQRANARGFGRTLNSVNEDEKSKKETEEERLFEISEPSTPKDVLKENIFSGKKRSIKQETQEVNKKIKVEKIDSASIATHHHNTVATEKENNQLISLEQHNIQAHQLSRQRPQTSYIYCPEAQHIIPASQTEDGQPSVIALLVPSDILNITAPGEPPSLTEVTCQVLEMNVLPIYPVSNVSDALQQTS